jgi:two-component system, response regulator / RNA-binding antiterminator
VNPTMKTSPPKPPTPGQPRGDGHHHSARHRISVGPAGLRVMLVDDSEKRMEMLARALDADGHKVIARLDSKMDLRGLVEQCQPDIIFIEVDAPGRDTLESLDQLNRECPRPVVLFAARSNADITRRAVRAGVSAYVVNGLHPSRLNSLMEVAIARFEMHQALGRQLAQAHTRLADQRDIEKAKGILMKRRGIDEVEAYSLLRKMAMDRNTQIGEVARAVLTTADVLWKQS